MSIAKPEPAVKPGRLRRFKTRPGDTGIVSGLMRAQFRVAQEASDRERRFRAQWRSPFDTSQRGVVTVKGEMPDSGAAAPSCDLVVAPDSGPER